MAVTCDFREGWQGHKKIAALGAAQTNFYDEIVG
jgi:hypothetical protein